MKKKREYPESALQRTCIKWFDAQYSEYRGLRMKLDNEVKTSIVMGAIKKAEGKLAGAADLFIAVPRLEHNTMQITDCSYGLFIEFKASPKDKQSINQVLFEKNVKSMDYQYEVVSSFDQFAKIINEYLKK